jgi:hypothetical protein
MLSDTIYFFYDIKKDEPKTKPKLVHHTISSSLFAMNEITISNKIRELNVKNGFRFYIFNKAERLKIAGVGPYNLDASIVKSNANRILLTFAECDLIYFDSYLSSLSSSKKYIFQLIECYRSLLRSIDLLVCNQLIHNGINFNTIVLKKDTPILTNFMFAIDFQNKSFDWSQYFLERPLNKFCPIEFYLLQYQVTNNQVLSLYNIETIIKEFIQNNELLVSNPDLAYFSRYANNIFASNIEEALKYCWTWDNYALSMVYLDILKNLKADNKFISYFMKLLVDNICLDPSKRDLPRQNLASFEEMLQIISITDFRELVI